MRSTKITFQPLNIEIILKVLYIQFNKLITAFKVNAYSHHFYAIEEIKETPAIQCHKNPCETFCRTCLARL